MVKETGTVADQSKPAWRVQTFWITSALHVGKDVFKAIETIEGELIQKPAYVLTEERIMAVSLPNKNERSVTVLNFIKV